MKPVEKIKTRLAVGLQLRDLCITNMRLCGGGRHYDTDYSEYSQTNMDHKNRNGE